MRVRPIVHLRPEVEFQKKIIIYLDNLPLFLDHSDTSERTG